MNHLERIAAHLGELDAVLLTGASNCYYATGFMGEGAALVSRRGSVYITDSRYTEAAEKAIGGLRMGGQPRNAFFYADQPCLVGLRRGKGGL